MPSLLFSSLFPLAAVGADNQGGIYIKFEWNFLLPIQSNVVLLCAQRGGGGADMQTRFFSPFLPFDIVLGDLPRSAN